MHEYSNGKFLGAKNCCIQGIDLLLPAYFHFDITYSDHIYIVPQRWKDFPYFQEEKKKNLLLDSKSVNTLMASFWERKVVAVRVFFLSFYYPLISILTLHILTTYCATEMKGFPQHPLDGSFSIFFLSVLMFSLLITMDLNPFCLFVCFCGRFHKNPIKNYDFIPFLLCHKWKDFFNILLMAPSLSFSFLC